MAINFYHQKSPNFYLYNKNRMQKSMILGIDLEKDQSHQKIVKHAI